MFLRFNQNKNSPLRPSSFIAGALLASCSHVEQSVPPFSVSDELSEVIVCINQIELQNDQQAVVLNIGKENALPNNALCRDENHQVIANTLGINLLDLAGSAPLSALHKLSLKAGHYKQLNIKISKGSYAVNKNTGDKHPLYVPADDFIIDGFTVSVDGKVDFSLEFDTNKAIEKLTDKNGYLLRPTGIYLENSARHVNALQPLDEKDNESEI